MSNIKFLLYVKYDIFMMLSAMLMSREKLVTCVISII